MSTPSYFIDYISLIHSQLGSIFHPLYIWCFYEKLGLRLIMMFISTGIIAFAIPNLLDQSDCKPDRDAYVKSLFIKKRCRMKINSLLMLFFSMMAILTYLSIWLALSNSPICDELTTSTHGPERFSLMIVTLNLLSVGFALVALHQKIFCMKHKQ